MKKILTRFILCSFILILSTFVMSCSIDGGGNTTRPTDERFGVPEEVNASINLPEEYNGAVLAWSSDHVEVLNSQGMLFMPEEDVTVKLTVTITKAGKSETKTISVNVVPSKKDPFTVAYRQYEGKVQSQYYKNGSFTIGQYYKTYEVVYTSLNQDVIKNSGEIIQTDHDQEAVIEIRITNTENNEVRNYYKKTVVKEYSKESYAKLIADWVDSEVTEYKAGRRDKLPTTHVKYPSTITWNSGKDVVVTDDGTVVKPIEVVNDTISCQVQYQDATVSRKYQLENFGGNTLEGFLDAWLPYIMPSELITHKNYVEWISNDYYFHHQIPVYTGAVLNLIDGQPIEIDQSYYNDVINGSYKNRVWYRYDGTIKHPGLKMNASESEIQNENNNSNYVTQAYLDKAFYPGYVIPNEENILWVVVHESGMARPGEDALLLAKTQYNNVYVNDTYREASWNYQVDHGVIYQSFPDIMACWHAGGTHPSEIYAHCNSSSIGIEMCINADGNYDGSMHHDTKLVAMLCDKYNLTTDNIKRHYDMSGKECPAYMIRTNRWNQFLEWTTMELNAIKYLRDANVTWNVSDLDTLFTKGPNGLYYAKAVSEKTDVTITLDVVKGDYHFNRTVVLSLYPDTVDLSQWIWAV